MESGYILFPKESLVFSLICHRIFAVYHLGIDTYRMDMSKKTGRHGRRINTGKNTGEKNGMERCGNMTVTRGEAKESTANRWRSYLKDCLRGGIFQYKGQTFRLL
jgi:hypothetical protein